MGCFKTLWFQNCISVFLGVMDLWTKIFNGLRLLTGDIFALNASLGSQNVCWVKTVISPNFLMWKFFEKAQFPNSFRLFARNCAETVPFRKLST